MAGVEDILIMTGDKPMGAKGVFELDSIGLLQLVRNMNNESYISAQPGNLDKVHQFFPGAVVSPFKSGVDIGGVYNFEIFVEILRRGAEIGSDWQKFKDNLYWPAKDGFYLYDKAGKKVAGRYFYCCCGSAKYCYCGYDKRRCGSD
jgi:hypothetical protein